MNVQKLKLRQSPFVNVLKLVESKKSLGVEVRGKVKKEIDKYIGKQVYRLSGKTPSNNTLTIPKRVTSSLQLVGQFCYLHLCVDPDITYAFRLTVVTKDDHTLKLSFSNLYKTIKKKTTGLFIPSEAVLVEKKWTVLVLDLAKIVHVHYGKIYRNLKRLSFSSTMIFRNAYTSPIVYSHDKLPRDMFLPLRKGQNRKELKWEDQYAWVWYPEAPQLDHFTAPGVTVVKEKSVGGSSREAESPRIREGKAQRRPRRIRKRRNARKLSERLMVTEKPAVSRLVQVIGYSTSKISWLGNREILYSSYDRLIRLDVTNRQQVIFKGTQIITCFAVNVQQGIVVSGETVVNKKGKKTQKKTIPLLRVWDLASGECHSVVYGGFHRSITALDISTSGNTCVVVGDEENTNRQLVLLYDLSKPKQPRIVVRGNSIYDIKCVKFEPFSESSFVSCGEWNMRFWRVKSGSLRSTSINSENFETSPSLLKNVFVDISFEFSFENRLEKDYHVYLSTKSGAVYSVEYQKRLVECVYQLHDGEIASLDVNEGMCASGSSDKYVRVWPLDFSDYFLEIEHDSPVCAVSLSEDGLLLIIGCKNGSIGLLNLTNQQFNTVLRCHLSAVCDVDINQKRGEFATVSVTDKSTRIWDLSTYDQLYQFDTLGETPLLVKYHPQKYQIAIGFDSGVIRIFDVQTTTVIEEYKPHNSSVREMSFFRDEWLLTLSDVNLCIADKNYQQVKVMYFKEKLGGIAQMAVSSRSFACIIERNVINVFSSTFDLSHTFETQSSEEFTQIEFSKDEKFLFATTSDLRLLKMDMENGRVVQEVEMAHRSRINSLQVSENGKFLASCSNDRIVKMWECGSLRYQAFLGHSAGVNKVRLKGDVIVTVGNDAICVWKFLDAEMKPEMIVDTIMQKKEVEEQDEEEIMDEEMTELKSMKPDFDMMIEELKGGQQEEMQHDEGGQQETLLDEDVLDEDIVPIIVEGGNEEETIN